jgi:hypothetical protein
MSIVNIHFFDVYADIKGMENETKFSLRLPTELYNRIGRKADEQRRSINGQMVVMLEDWFIDRGGPISSEDLLRILRERLELVDPVFDVPREEGEEDDEDEEEDEGE